MAKTVREIAKFVNGELVGIAASARILARALARGTASIDATISFKPLMFGRSSIPSARHAIATSWFRAKYRIW